MILVLLVCVLALLAAPLAAAVPPTAETFFRSTEFSDVRLSPDGRYLAAIARVDELPDARNLAVMEIDTRRAHVLTGYEDEDIRWFRWIDDERLLFKLDSNYDATTRSAEYRGMYSINRDGSEGRMLHEPYARDRRSLGSSTTQGVGGLRESVELVDRLPADDRHVLVTRAERRFLFPDVYRMNVRNGRMKKAASVDGNVMAWFADNSGVVRVAVDAGEERDDLTWALLHRAGDDEPWQALLEFHYSDLEVFGFDADDRHLWLGARIERDRFALYRLDTQTGALGEPFHADDVYDICCGFGRVQGLVRDDDGNALYLQYMADTPRTIHLDKRWEARQEVLDRALPDTVNTIVGWDHDQTRFLVSAWSDRVSGEYYLYDEKAAKIQYLLDTRSWLETESMARMRPIVVPARDGVVLRGYLTLPVDAGDEPSPMVVMPHGGPYGIRDTWRFDPEVQFLASRGYAVLQINFRGSGGYGSAFETSGYRRWGLEMQDDITDAVRWTIDRGHADPERICIYGASYGGYATLMGLIGTPELYRCGIDYVGVVDLELLHKDIGRTSGISGLQFTERWFETAIGDPVRDAERFRQTSPIHHVERIEAPLLVIHGQLDFTVDIEHYRRLVAALRRHDKTFESVTETYEGHGFRAQTNRVGLYRRIERFLAAHLN